jgi:hypothetical protein
MSRMGEQVGGDTNEGQGVIVMLRYVVRCKSKGHHSFSFQNLDLSTG